MLQNNPETDLSKLCLDCDQDIFTLFFFVPQHEIIDLHLSLTIKTKHYKPKVAHQVRLLTELHTLHPCLHKT